ncbi:hypothetical protein AJ78_01970 [Emergomyces pasteurianus Ep9510]|uniref:Uncharacterized protein n=1 Tax=Emergomyces pasteurianus Ep9510 TaxID=1447872 RepID=A0A1J9QCJ4_9EURO|nr:hypothetical protein AJ78_01970 [Emergomyces pasteurianus Ep9510]
MISPRASETPQKTARGDRDLGGIQSPELAAAKHLFLRQDVVKCQTGLGRGDCVEAGSCRGFFETDRNLCPQGDGPREPWPCIGPNDVQCCVKNDNINKTSSTSESSSATSSTTSSLPLPTFSTPPTTTNLPTTIPTNSQPPSAGSGGLSAGAKGGIAGGVVAAVLIMSLIAALFFILGKQRNAKKKASATEEGRPATPTAAEKRQEENTMTEKDDDTYGKPELLGGSPLSELPADSLAGELDSPAGASGGESKGDAAEKTSSLRAQERSKGPVELPANVLAQQNR